MIQQNTEEWLSEKIGCLTGTLAARVMGTPKVRRTLIRDMVIEIALARGKAFAGNKHTRKGKEDEPQAISAYRAFILDEGIVQTGAFVVSDESPFIGCSPDALIDIPFRPDIPLHGGCEIKNLSPEVHFDLLESEVIGDDYLWQVKWNLMVTKRQWWDFFAYCKELPPQMSYYHKRFWPDPIEHERMMGAATTLLDELFSILKKYNLVIQ